MQGTCVSQNSEQKEQLYRTIFILQTGIFIVMWSIEKTTVISAFNCVMFSVVLELNSCNSG